MGTEMKELKLRLEAKKKELEAQVARLKADSAGAATETLRSLESKLEGIKGDLSHAFENLSETAAAKLNKWLKD